MVLSEFFMELWLHSMFTSRRSAKLQKKSRKKSPLLFLLILLLLLSPAFFYALAYQFYFQPVILNPLSEKTFLHASSDELSPLRDELQAIHVVPSSLSVSSDSAGFQVRLSGGEEILFSREKNLHDQVASLQLILSRLTIEGKAVKRLDLRFDKPVIELK